VQPLETAQLLFKLYFCSVAYEAGGCQPPGLKNSGQTVFSDQAQIAKKS